MLHRRTLLLAGLASAAPYVVTRRARGTAAQPGEFTVHAWQRDPHNPILPPGPATFDVRCCMNPFVFPRGDEYWLFYCGGDKQNRRRICLATAPRDDLRTWKRRGPLLDLGGKGSFDELWCVLPCIHRIGDKWHLYYTGRSADTGSGLQGFRGIGLAISDDLLNWKKVSDEPVLLGDGFEQWPTNRGIAGGGRILEEPQAGRTLYRMHYTLATGTPSKDLRIDQAKQSVMAHSYDGREWFDKRIALQPRAEAAYENAATIALNVWKTKTRYRAIYAGIGTQFGAYSICEAVSDDGLQWQRGPAGKNLSLPPAGNGWESKMTEYPHVVPEGNQLRLFYCGNGYGSTGIGIATAPPLD
jgi:predicted GH43/DUF377 family glycosyl hydrolase